MYSPQSTARGYTCTNLDCPKNCSIQQRQPPFRASSAPFIHGQRHPGGPLRSPTIITAPPRSQPRPRHDLPCPIPPKLDDLQPHILDAVASHSTARSFPPLHDHCHTTWPEVFRTRHAPLRATMGDERFDSMLLGLAQQLDGGIEQVCCVAYACARSQLEAHRPPFAPRSP